MTDPAQHNPDPAPAYLGATASKPARKTNALAVISLVAGLCGFSLVPFFGSIAAVVTGHLALGQIRDSGEDGSTFAKAGLWLGYIGLGLLVLALVGLFGLLAVRSSVS